MDACRTSATCILPGNLCAMSDEVPERTGVAVVDEAVDAVTALADAPITEHAAVYASAHDALRRALDTDPEA